ncbi:LuxR C-terminal-related transcriptional regulator [Gordonia sp. CPCC 205333]|uniref:LuxR C-terminal-related transcriptional regulator n=1 Tax=Gordonia sp. CPCC 205333 TaxID=3140790 RepID=UPI003AF38254
MTDRLNVSRGSVRLTRPVARNVVSRPRVLEIFDNARILPCVLLCAPAGYGKSLAVASWLDERGLSDAAWVNVGAIGDNESSIWAGIVDALARRGDDTDELEEVVGLADRAPSEVARRLARWITQRPDEVIIVLDDLNGVTGEKIHDQVVEFIAAGGPNLHLVAITRHDPPWPLHRMRADGMLIDIRTDVLRFNNNEAGSLFAQLDVGLSGDELTAIVGRTEGWAAGLRLAALGLTGADDPTAFIADFSGCTGYIADYLMNEVYLGLPKRWQDFLARVSTVDEVCPDLAAALGGGPHSSDILSELSHLNAFIHELGDHLGWYRIHPLLLDFLRSRVTDRLRRVELHRAAATWYHDQDEPLSALHHALSGEDWSFAAELVGINVVTWTVRQSPMDLISILAAVPREMMLLHPGFAVGTAAAQAMAGAASGLRELAAATRAELHRVGEEERRRYEFLLDLIELGVMRWAGDFSGVLAGCRAMPTDARVLAGLGIADWSALRVLLKSNAGTCELWLGDIAAARGHLLDAAQPSLGVKAVLPVHNARAHLAYLCWEAGELTASARWAAEAISGFAAVGIPDDSRQAVAFLALAGVSLDRDELDESARWLDKAASAATDPATLFAVVLMRTQLALAIGDAYGAASILRTGRSEIAESILPPSLIENAARVDEVITVRLASSRHPSGPTNVRTTLASAAAPRHLLEELLDDVVAATSLGDKLDVLEQALTFASDVDLRRPFLARENELRILLSQRIENGTSQTAFALDLLSRMSAADIRRSGSAELFVPLSDREMNVLRYLVSSLTTAEIADSLYISVNTVKTHQRSIYQKLAASGRREAVVRGRELGLV